MFAGWAMVAAILLAVSVSAVLNNFAGFSRLNGWRIADEQMTTGRPAATMLPRLHDEGERLLPASRMPYHSEQPLQISYQFEAGASEFQEMAILAHGIGGQARAFVNFAPVRTMADSPAGDLVMPGTRTMLWEVPANHLHRGPNRIDLVIAEGNGRALVGPVHFGPRAELAQIALRWEQTANTLQLVLVAAATLAMIASLLASGFCRGAKHIATAAAFSVIAARGLLHLVGAGSALEAPALESLLLVVMVLCAATAMRAGTNAAKDAAMVERACLSAAVLLSAIVVWAAISGRAGLVFWGVRLAGTIALMYLAWSIVAAVRHGSMPPGRSASWQAWTGAIGGLLLFAGVIMLAGLAEIRMPGAPFAPLIGLVIALVVLALLSAGAGLSTVAASLRTRFDHLRTIREQRAALEATTLALEEQTRQSLLLEERQRMARDVHDGIGGQLATLIAQVRLRRIGMDQVEQALVGGLSELRFLVGSLDVMGTSLADALASFLDQARQQTAAAGIALHWNQSLENAEEVRDARWILNIYRLMQEALTNAMRHSGGDSIAISIFADDGQFAVRIEDNGRGLDPASVRRGRGLNNMARRASDLGGACSILSPGSAEGTVISVKVPFP